MVPATRGLDVEHQWLVLQAVEISKATFGGIGLRDVMDMAWDDLKAVIEQLSKKPEGKSGNGS